MCGAVARLRVFEHLLIAVRVAEGGVRPAADHHVNAFRLAGGVVEQHQLGLFGKCWPTVLVISIFSVSDRAHDLLWRNTIHSVGIDSHEILAAARGDIRLVPA